MYLKRVEERQIGFFGRKVRMFIVYLFYILGHRKGEPDMNSNFIQVHLRQIMIHWNLSDHVLNKSLIPIFSVSVQLLSCL